MLLKRWEEKVCGEDATNYKCKSIYVGLSVSQNTK